MTALNTVKNELAQVRGRMTELMRCDDAMVDECLSELAVRQGKMIRPTLILLFARAGGGVQPLHINMAAVVEMIHTASLLHDDVIDEAEMRRSRPTANVLWGNTAAVLLGDFLLSRAFSELAVDLPKTAARVLGRAAEVLCTGELKQNLFRGKWDLSEHQYFDIIRAKTAALFECSCRLGVVAAAPGPRRDESAGAYGHHLGMAFQIMDDLADISAASRAHDKTPGTDFLHRKVTLPVLYWLNQDAAAKDERIKKLDEMCAEELAAALHESGCFEKAYGKAKEHSRLAVQQLDDFADAAPGELRSLAEGIVAPIL